MKFKKLLSLFTAFSLTATMFGTFPAGAVPDTPTTKTIASTTGESATGTMTINLKLKPQLPDFTVSLDNWKAGATAKNPVIKGLPQNESAICAYKVQGADDSTYSLDAPTEEGNYTIRATFAGNDNYRKTTATADFSVTDPTTASLKITLVIPAITYTLVEAQEATCSKAGNVAYYLGSDKNKYLLVEGSYVIATDDDIIIPIKEHKSTCEVIREATCTSGGINRYTCSVCGVTYTQTTPMLGHNKGEAVEENRTEPTCTEPGSVDTVVYCTRCKEELSRETTAIETLGHKYDPTTHICERCNEVDPEAFPAYKTKQKKVADALAQEGDSEKALALITAAKDAIDAVTYNEKKTFDENAAVIDAMIEQLKLDLAAQRENDVAEDYFARYCAAQKKAADGLSEDTDSDACLQLIADAKDAIDALTYDSTKTLDENRARVDEIIEQLKLDLAAQREADDAQSAFAAYKAAQKAVADGLGKTTDSDAAKKLITDAKAAINALAYNANKTLDENKAAVDAIIEQLKLDLAAQREDDDAEGAFAQYKTLQKTAADNLAETGDSNACKQLITDAKAAINALAYNANKTLAENKAAVDAIIEQLKLDLAAQRENDDVEGAFAQYKKSQKAAADNLAETGDSDAAKKLITDAKAAIDAVIYDPTKTIAENKAAVDAIIEQLKLDLAAQRENDDAEGAFAQYKKSQKAAADGLAETGDSNACKQLITDAKATIDAVIYDSTKTITENKARVDAIIEQLKTDLAAQRIIDGLDADSKAFEMYKTDRKAYADTLANEPGNKAEKKIIDAAKSDIAALEYDKTRSLADNKTRVDAIIDRLSKDIAQYWSTVTFIVSFITYCDTELAPITVNYGSTVTEPAALTREGYNLNGWLLNGAKYDFTNPVKSNITLAANWTPIKYNVTFMFNGEKYSEAIVEHGKRVEFPNIVVKDGFALFGWATDPELTKGFTALTPVTENLVLYAEEKTSAIVLIDGEKAGSIDDALQSVNGDDNFINLYEDQNLKKINFPKNDTSIVISGNGNTIGFDGTANLTPKQELALDDITIAAANKNGAPQNINIVASKGGLSISDVTLEGKNAAIKGSKGNVTLGDIDSSKCAQLNVNGNKKTTLDVDGEVTATKVSGFGTVTVSDTLTVTKNFTADTLIIEEGAVLNIAAGATVTINKSISGYGTIHLAKGYKSFTVKGKAYGKIIITADDKFAEKAVLFKTNIANLNDTFDISAIVPEVTDGDYEYGLYLKSGSAYVRAFRLQVADKTYCEWSDIIAMIKNAKASGANYTVKLLDNVDLGSSFTLPARGKYAGLTIDGGGYTLTFKGKALSLTGNTTFTNVTVKSHDSAWTLKKNGFTLTADMEDLVGCTVKEK